MPAADNLIPSTLAFAPWILVLALVGVLAFVLTRKRSPDSHSQAASHGGVINHHHDARVIVTVTVDRQDG